MSGAPPRHGVASPPLEREIVATLALAAYSLVVAAGFRRVFGEWDFLRDLAVIVVVGHGASLVLRRVRVSAWIAVPALVLLLAWVIVLQHYRETTSALLPTSETWQLFRLETDLVREQFRTAVAPVLYGTGWAPLAGIATAVIVVIADTFAFRARVNGEALAPGGVLFVVIAALGTDQDRVPLTAALVATGFVAVVALRALHDRSRRVELVARRNARSGLVPAVLGAAACIAVVAAVVGPRLPGADAEALYDTRNRSGGVTEVTSPLVTIRSRLVNQRNLEVFRVSSTAESYWRLTALPEFDGESFKLPQRPLRGADDSLAAARPGAVEIRQTVQIRELASPFLPAAADPVGVTPNADLRWNPDTSTLITTEDELAFGAVYEIRSASPRTDPAQLRATTSSNVPDPIHVELPDGFPDEVAELARDVTAGATTPYDQALALQNWFRSEFRYSTEVQRGHGTTAIESFLNERVGYCEQFAATFAAMARTLQIPSRVAVGFTPGLQNPDGSYSVFGKNAHAWPEIWFDGIGWVPFEPTPGRGAPGQEGVTGVPAEQDTTPNTGGGGTVTDRPPITTPNSFQVPSDPDAVPTTLPAGGLPAPVDATGTDAGGGLPTAPFVVLGLVAIAVAAPAVVRRARRRLGARSGAIEQVRRSWDEAVDAAVRAGVRVTPSMTPRQVATATAAVLPVAARPIWSLARTVDAVTYARPGTVDLDAVGSYGTSVVRDCANWARQVGEVVDDSLTGPDRLRRYFTNWA